MPTDREEHLKTIAPGRILEVGFRSLPQVLPRTHLIADLPTLPTERGQNMDHTSPNPLDRLRALRRRAADRRSRGPLFAGVLGYEETVMPQITNAILSKHNFILLGLRGQAKSRIRVRKASNTRHFGHAGHVVPCSGFT